MFTISKSVSNAFAVSYFNYDLKLIDCDDFYGMKSDDLHAWFAGKRENYDNVVVIPVHLYGYPANINEILEIASSNNIQIIEDGAQSLGSKYYGKMCGALGNIGCTSFYPTKVITSGEGGIITTNNDVVYDNLLKIRNHGFNKNNQTTRLGLNFRMPEIEAAIVSTQLNKLDNFIKEI